MRARRGEQWAAGLSLWLELRATLEKDPRWLGCCVFISCLCSFLEIAEKLQGNWILEIHVPGPFAVVCILLMSIGFPRSLLVLCS